MSGKLKSMFSESNQVLRITILAGILLVLLVVAFGGYYYYDRYYHAPQPAAQEVNVAQAEQAVRDDPQNVDSRLALSETYMFNQQFADAIAQANQVLAVDPENQRAWLVIGVSSANLGKPADAIDPLTRFINARKDEEMPGLDQSLQAAAYFLGESYMQLGKPQEAIEPLSNAVNWSKTDADAMYKLGMAYAAIQDYPNAVNMFHAATTFVPNFKEAYDAMATAYDAAGKPEYGDYARGMSAYSQKDYQTAVDLLLKATQALPDFSISYAGLGLAYEGLGNLQAAKDAYNAALGIDPTNFTASTGLERVDALINGQ
jgi:tetratricopeptide (TPR) repeat protein